MKEIRALLKLHKGYGLGDAVQMTSVLRHLKRYLPHWTIDYQADVGRHSAAYGHVRNVYTYDDVLTETYDHEIEIVLYDTFSAWEDRPNTRVVSCLHEKFGIQWDRELADYRIHWKDYAIDAAYRWLAPFKQTHKGFVALHYSGDSSQEKKNLFPSQAGEVMLGIRGFGMTPLLLDWRNHSVFSEMPNEIVSVAKITDREAWGRDAQINALLIHQCKAFIGIDSGPGKCASASGVPTLICWTGHHPALYHDLSPNTTHLIPVWHSEIEPVNGNQAVIQFFLANYNVLFYDEKENTLVSQVKKWLEHTLKA